jgi:threonine dehydrogenase-like Zn-dependent dehydrogenase
MSSSAAPEIEFARVVRNGQSVLEALPRLGVGDLLVRLRAALVGQGELAWQFAAGRAVVADVIEVGEDSPFKPGQRIFAAWKAACGICEACSSGNETNCNDWERSSLRPAGLASQYVVPAWNARKASLALASDQPASAQVFLDALACHCRGLRRAGEILVRRVVVQGSGIQVLLWGLVLEARHLSAQRILCSDVSIPLSHRSYGYQEMRSSAESLEGLDGEGVDLIVLTNPDSKWLAWAFARINTGGTILLSGQPTGVGELDLETLAAREIRLVVSRDCAAKDLRSASELLPQLSGRLESLTEMCVDFETYTGDEGPGDARLPTLVTQK